MLNFKKRNPNILESTIPIVFLIGMLSLSVHVFGDKSSNGPNQMALILAGIVAGTISIFHGKSWKVLEEKILENINLAMQAILILLLMGAMIGIWILAGIVPTLIVWGLQLISYKYFLFTTCFFCAVISLATGSSWTTAGTVGLAMIGIGNTLGINSALTAGAIVSGAYFGDKMSPLSETTNMAPSVAGTNLYTHIRHMLATSLPSILLTLLIFLFIGLFSSASGYSSEKIEKVTFVLRSKFHISLLVFISPIVVIGLVVRRLEAIPALLVGCLGGIITAVVFQKEAILEFAKEPNYLMAIFKAGVSASSSGFSAESGSKEVDALLSRGGMIAILPTVWLILSAMFFGGIMEGSGMLFRITQSVLSLAKNTSNLIAATIGTCFFINLTAADQYLSILITGRMYKESYRLKDLAPENLSRALEDSGTLSSPLVPWNSCGAFMAASLGVSTLAYFPFCFFNLINPVISLIYAFTGFTIRKISSLDGHESTGTLGYKNAG